MQSPGERHNPARGVGEWAATYGGVGMAAPAQLTRLPLEVLDDWAGVVGERQPFKPYTQDKLEELAENIQKNGVIEPIHARPKPGGRFEIIAGHNRCAAAKLAGLTTIPALVQQLDDAEAAILLVDSNLQHREKLLPSEKAFAYKLRLESLKRQGQRTDLTSGPMGQKLSRDELAEESGDSSRQIQRYIRLTCLIPPLLDLVDNDKFGFRAAVEVSYLNVATQNCLQNVMEEASAKAPNLSQAQKLRQLFQAETLDEDTVRNVLVTKKAAKPPQLKLPASRIGSFFPPETTPEQMEAAIVEALRAYSQESKMES